jgi:hypothetical protein
MKLIEILEARYSTSTTEYSNWVKKEITKYSGFREYRLDDLDDVRAAVEDLTNAFGQPDMHDDEEEYEYWGWQLQDDNDSYAVFVNTSPELFVERFKDYQQTDVNPLDEASYAGSHAIVNWIEDQIRDNEYEEEWWAEKKTLKKETRQIYTALTTKYGQPDHTWIDDSSMVPELRMDTLGDRGVYTSFSFEWNLTPTLILSFGYSPPAGCHVHLTTADPQ